MSGYTTDRFLNGRVTASQPETGFRSGLDAVCLAAAVPATADTCALELGAGAGVASLCLAARVEGCKITGVEIDAHLAACAQQNAALAGISHRLCFVAGDVLDLPDELRREFQHVFSNPPFHADAGERSPVETREQAVRDRGAFAEWLTAGVRRTASGGTFTAIFRADRLQEALAALPAGGIVVFPLWPRAGEPAKRVIVQHRKGSRAPLAVLAGLVLHEPGGAYTPEADAVLRDAAALALALS